jgi:hypothetical protein
VDWAEAIEGFVDAEAKSFGEVVVIQGRAIDAVVGSSTLNAQLDSGGYLASEQVELGFISPVKYGGEPTRVNDLIELRDKVWRVQEVRHNEGGLGLSVICELLPGVEPEGILYTIPETPGNVDVLEKIRQVVYYQPDTPSNITRGILSARPGNILASTTPSNPSQIVIQTEPFAPQNIEAIQTLSTPTNVQAITTPIAPGQPTTEISPLAPGQPGVESSPQTPSGLVVYTEDPNFNFPTDFSSSIGAHEIVHLTQYYNQRFTPITYPPGTIWRTTGISTDQTQVRAEDPNYPRATPYTGGANAQTGNWAWFQISARGTNWEFAIKAQ